MIKLNAATRLAAGHNDHLEDNKFYICYMDGPRGRQDLETYSSKGFASRSQAEAELNAIKSRTTDDEELDLLYECMVESGKKIKDSMWSKRK